MPRHGGKTIAILAAVAALFPCLSALAQDTSAQPLLTRPNEVQVVLLSALIGVVGFAVWSAIALIRARRRTEAENTELRGQVAGLKATADRAEALVTGEDQRLVAWGAPGEPPLVAGKLPDVAGAPADRAGFLAFGTWLKPESASRLDHAVTQLRNRGESFAFTIATTAGRLIEASGRTVGGSAVVRFRDLTGDRLALAEIEAKNKNKK